MSVSALMPKCADMIDFISCKLRMNIYLSFRPRAMSCPSFSMKQPSWLNRPTSLELSKLADGDKIHRDDRYMQDILNVSLVIFFAKWNIVDVPNRMTYVVSSFNIARSICLSKFSEPFLMRRHMVCGTGVDERYIF